MTKRGWLILLGFGFVLVCILLMSNIFVARSDNERWVSLSCGMDGPVTYPKAGVYWKDCSSPKPIYLFND